MPKKDVTTPATPADVKAAFGTSAHEFKTNDDFKILRGILPQVAGNTELESVVTKTSYNRIGAAVLDNNDFESLAFLLQIGRNRGGDDTFIRDRYEELRDPAYNAANRYLKKFDAKNLEQLYQTVDKFPVLLKAVQDCIKSRVQRDSYKPDTFAERLQNFRGHAELMDQIDLKDLYHGIQETLFARSLKPLAEILQALEDESFMMMYTKEAFKQSLANNRMNNPPLIRILGTVKKYPAFVESMKETCLESMQQELLTANVVEFPELLKILKETTLYFDVASQQVIAQKIATQAAKAESLLDNLETLEQHTSLTPGALTGIVQALAPLTPDLRRIFRYAVTNRDTPLYLRKICQTVLDGTEPKPEPGGTA